MSWRIKTSTRWWPISERNQSKAATQTNPAQRRPPSARQTRQSPLEKGQWYFIDHKNMLTLHIGANVPVLCLQSDAQIKAAKIRLALRKLAEAKVRKVRSVSFPPAATALGGRDLASSRSWS